jgi:hypothetical protein
VVDAGRACKEFERTKDVKRTYSNAKNADSDHVLTAFSEKKSGRSAIFVIFV